MCRLGGAWSRRRRLWRETCQSVVAVWLPFLPTVGAGKEQGEILVCFLCSMSSLGGQDSPPRLHGRVAVIHASKCGSSGCNSRSECANMTKQHDDAAGTWCFPLLFRIILQLIFSESKPPLLQTQNYQHQKPYGACESGVGGGVSDKHR